MVNVYNLQDMAVELRKWCIVGLGEEGVKSGSKRKTFSWRSRHFWNARKSDIKGNMLVAERTEDDKCCYCSLSTIWGRCHSQNPLNSGYTSWAGWPIPNVTSEAKGWRGGGASMLVKGIGEHVLHQRHRMLLQLLSSPMSNTATIKLLQSDMKRPHIYTWEYWRNTWLCSAPALWLHQLVIPVIPGSEELYEEAYQQEVSLNKKLT